MELIFAWHVDADSDIERALMYDKVEQAARIGQGVEAGNRVLESWVLRSHGRMVSDEGCTGSAQLSAEYLEELPDILRQVEEATQARMFVGVGSEPSEAVIARRVAEKRGGDPAIVLYTPDLSKEAEELDEMSDDEADEFDNAGEAVDDEDLDLSKAEGCVHCGSKKGYDRTHIRCVDCGKDYRKLGKAEDNQQEGGEATQVAQGKLSPGAAAPSPPPSASISAGSPSAPQGQPGQQPPQGGQEPSEEDVLGAIGQVLQQFKAQVPFFEQQVKQANPQAYQAVMGMVQGMIALAQQVAGGNAEGTPPPGAGGGSMQKSEGQEAGSMPVSNLLVSNRSLNAATNNVQAGRGSRTKGPLSVWRLEDGRNLLVDGHHRLVEHLRRGRKSVPYKLVGEGYTDYWATPQDPAAFGKSEQTKVELDPNRRMPPMEELRKLYNSTMLKGEASPTAAHFKEFVAGFQHEAKEHPHLNATQAALTAKQHLAEDPQYYSKLGLLEESGVIGEGSEPLDKAAPAAHHHVVLPVGSQGVGAKGRSIKVLEPVTGKASWHQMATGRKLSGDGHALSTKVGECPSADTPESRASKAGLVGTPTASEEKPPQTAQLPGK